MPYLVGEFSTPSLPYAPFKRGGDSLTQGGVRRGMPATLFDFFLFNVLIDNNISIKEYNNII